MPNPRFSEDAIARNNRLADLVAEVAKDAGATSAQVALAWLLSVVLRPEQLARLESLLNDGVVGSWY